MEKFLNIWIPSFHGSDCALSIVVGITKPFSNGVYDSKVLLRICHCPVEACCWVIFFDICLSAVYISTILLNLPGIWRSNQAELIKKQTMLSKP